jgi:hypothetical protein
MSFFIVAWSILLPRVLIPRALTRAEGIIGRVIQGTAQIRGVNYSPMEGITIREIAIDSPLVQGSLYDLQAQPNLGFLLGFSQTPVDTATLGYVNLRLDGTKLGGLFDSSGTQPDDESLHQSEQQESVQTQSSSQEVNPEGLTVPNPDSLSSQTSIADTLQLANQLFASIVPLMPRQFRISSGDVEFAYQDQSLLAHLEYGLWTSDGGSWSAQGVVRSQLGVLEVAGTSGNDLGLTSGSLKLNSLSLSSIPSWMPIPGALRLIPQGVVDGSVQVSAIGQSTFRVTGQISLTDGILDWSVFASEPVQIPSIQYDFVGYVDLISPIPAPLLIPTPDPPRVGPGGIFSVESGNLTLGSLNGQFTPSILGFLNQPLRITFGLNLPTTPIQEIIETAPEILRRGFSGMEIEGTFGWDFFLELPMDRIGHIQWKSVPVLEDLHIRTFPGRFSPFGLNQGFPFRFTTRPDSPDYLILVEPRGPIDFDFLSSISEQTPLRMQRRVEQLQEQVLVPDVIFGPPNPRKLPAGISSLEPNSLGGSDQSTRSRQLYNQLSFIPLEHISPYLIKAVLTGEDGDFFFHPGFNWNTLRSAIERNLRSGQVQFGASTISMQLVKNLLLDDSRELVRKLQEAFLVYLMEHRAGIFKDRILELYLNIAPFGPGSPGIHGGAQHFFQKHPRDLNLLESVWLATMLPSPFRFSGFIVDGAPAPFWFPRMQFFLDVMLERGRITEDDHNHANPATLRFRPNLDLSQLSESIGDDEIESTDLGDLFNNLFEEIQEEILENNTWYPIDGHEETSYEPIFDQESSRID